MVKTLLLPWLLPHGIYPLSLLVLSTLVSSFAGPDFLSIILVSSLTLCFLRIMFKENIPLNFVLKNIYGRHIIGEKKEIQG